MSTISPLLPQSQPFITRQPQLDLLFDENILYRLIPTTQQTHIERVSLQDSTFTVLSQTETLDSLKQAVPQNWGVKQKEEIDSMGFKEFKISIIDPDLGLLSKTIKYSD